MSVIEEHPVRRRLAIAGIAVSVAVAVISIVGVALLAWWQSNLPDFDLTVDIASGTPPTLTVGNEFDVIVSEYSAVTLAIQGDVGAARVLTGISRALAFSVVPAGAVVVMWVLVKYLQDQRLARSVSRSLAFLGVWLMVSTVVGQVFHAWGVAAAVEALGLPTGSIDGSDVVMLPSIWVDDLVRAGVVSGVVLLVSACLVRWGNAAHDELTRVV